MPEIQHITLDCGAKLAVERVTSVRSAGVTWLCPGGSASDPADRLGACAVLRDCLLRGAGELDSRQQADAFDRLGVRRSTDAGGRVFAVDASMVGDRIHDALALLAAMIREPRLTDETVEPTRDLCLQAIESLADEPQERAVLGARTRHHPSPYNRNSYGTREGLNACTPANLAEHWARCVVPAGTCIAVNGNVDPDKVAARLNELLAGWSGDYTQPEPGATPERGYAHERDTSNQVQVVHVSDAPPVTHEDSVLERTATAVLSGGMSGRLFTEVREKRGLCYAVHAIYGGDERRGSLTSYVGTTPERAQASLEVLEAELERLRTDGGKVTAEEFERAHVGMKSRVVFSGESTSARASAMASDLARRGRARTLEEVAAEIDAVTLDRVHEYLTRKDPGVATIQTLGPEPLR